MAPKATMMVPTTYSGLAVLPMVNILFERLLLTREPAGMARHRPQALGNPGMFANQASIQFGGWT